MATILLRDEAHSKDFPQEPDQRENQSNHDGNDKQLVRQKLQRKKDEFTWPFGIRFRLPHHPTLIGMTPQPLGLLTLKLRLVLDF